jgi:glycosyltransferase involved in cell wall biosynthesis
VPKVSVITAAYNHVGFVRQSVESVLNQTYKDFEHIVVDDGSTDGTAEVLRSFGAQIKYFRQQNCGTPAAINRGIRESSGEYIAILDSDDVWLPEKLDRQMRCFAQQPEAGMVYSRAYFINRRGEVSNNSETAGRDVGGLDGAYEEVLRDNCIPVVTAVICRTSFEDVGFFDERLKALWDWEFWLRLARKRKIVFVPDVVSLYRVHGNNTFTGLSESGDVAREQLSIMKGAMASLIGGTREVRTRKRAINTRFAYTLARDVYGLSCQRQFSRALSHFLFGLSLRPAFWKDLPAALTLEPNLCQRGRPLRIMKRLTFGNHELRNQKRIETS